MQIIMTQMKIKFRMANVMEYAASTAFSGCKLRKHHVPGYCIAYCPNPNMGRDENKIAASHILSNDILPKKTR